MWKNATQIALLTGIALSGVSAASSEAGAQTVPSNRVAPTNCPGVQVEDKQARAGDPVAALCALSTEEHSQQGLICEKPNMRNLLACIEHNKLRIFYASVIAKNSPDEALRRRFGAYVVEFTNVVRGWERDYRYNTTVRRAGTRGYRGESTGRGHSYPGNSYCVGGLRAFGEYGPTYCP